jgi:hypothetical protein
VWRVFELQIFFQRRRKVLVRLAALLVLGFGGLLAVLPRADANDVSARVAQLDDSKTFLLSPEPMSGERFSAFYGLAHR